MIRFLVIQILASFVCLLWAQKQSSGVWWEVTSTKYARAGIALDSRLLFVVQAESLGREWLAMHRAVPFSHIFFWLVKETGHPPLGPPHSEGPRDDQFIGSGLWHRDAMNAHAEQIQFGDCVVFRSVVGGVSSFRTRGCGGKNPLQLESGEKSVEIRYVAYRYGPARFSDTAARLKLLPSETTHLVFGFGEGEEKATVFLKSSAALTKLESADVVRRISDLIPIRPLGVEIRTDDYFLHADFERAFAFVEDLSDIDADAWRKRWRAACLVNRDGAPICKQLE